jgi:hypothetical protein
MKQEIITPEQVIEYVVYITEERNERGTSYQLLLSPAKYITDFKSKLVNWGYIFPFQALSQLQLQLELWSSCLI